MPGTDQHAGATLESITGETPIPAWALNLAALGALSAALVALAGFGGVYSYVSTPVYVALFAMLCVVAVTAASQASLLPWTPVLAPMLGFGLLTIAQYLLPISVYPGFTLTGIIALAGCGATFYLAFVGFRDPQRLRWLRAALFTTTAVLSIETILQFFTANRYIYWFHNATYAWPMGPYVYNNQFAGCMDLLLPPVISVLFIPPRSEQPPTLLLLQRSLVPMFGLISVVLSASRGGFATIIFEAVLGAVVFWPELKRVRVRALSAAVAAVVFLAGLVAVPWRPLLSRFGDITNDADLISRLRVDQSCLMIFRDHPLWGTGFNTFAAIYPRYALFDTGKVWLYAHNEYAQLLAETGVLGIVCALVFVALWTRSFWRCRKEHLPLRRFRLALFIGMAGLMFHSLIDFQFHAPANALLFFLFAGATAAQVPRIHRRRRAAHA